jgi:Family of unknown function (DUF6191)
MTQWGLDTLFNPAKRHMDEEKRRLQSTREEIGDASGGKRIDLESGKVTIQRAADDDEQAAESGAVAASTQLESAASAETDAQRRARLRRARARSADSAADDSAAEDAAH